MLPRVIDPYAEFATAAVEVEGAGLEDGEAVPRVEVGEVDEVVSSW
jgi:hypothetical protein